MTTEALDARLQQVRTAIPILGTEVHGQPLVYLDNAATTQVPECVIQAMGDHLRTSNANVHRGTHALSIEATERMEKARASVARFLGAANPEEVVFAAGATDALNLLSSGLQGAVGPKDAVLVTQMEHHSNLSGWQALCARTGAELRVAPVDGEGSLDLKAFAELLDDKHVRIAAFAHASNVTGALNPIEELCSLARGAGALSVVDASQAMRQGTLDVTRIGCDFLAFSGHKMCGPTGIGVLYGRPEALERVAPSRFGGGMVSSVTLERTEAAPAPHGLEAGTPNIMGIVGLEAAVGYLEETGLGWVGERERHLTARLRQLLDGVDGIELLGPPEGTVGAVAVACRGLHPHDVASVLDRFGVAVRTGHHCAQPYLRALGHESVLRLSPAFYNTEGELAFAAESLERALSVVEGWEAR